MGLSYRDAIAAVSAPGMPFEVREVERDGVRNREFVNAPPTLRDYFGSSRGLEATFLVYEDEEWSFNDVMVDVDALASALVNRYHVSPGDRVGIAMRNLPEWHLAPCGNQCCLQGPGPAFFRKNSSHDCLLSPRTQTCLPAKTWKQQRRHRELPVIGGCHAPCLSAAFHWRQCSARPGRP